MSDIFECAKRELLRRKSRTLANILGYALAVGLMVVLVNFLLFSKYAASSVLTTTGTHFIAFTPSCREFISLTPQQLEGISKGVVPPECKEQCKECVGCLKKPIDFKNEGFVANTVLTKLVSIEMVDKVRKLATVKDAAPYLLFRFKDPVDGHIFTVGGFDPKNQSAVGTTCCAPSDILSGAFLQPGDRGVVMLEEAYALSRNVKVGGNVIIAGISYSVIGIINPGIRPAKADIYMRFEDAQIVINKRIKAPLFNEINVVLVEVASSKVQDQAIAEVKKIIQGGVISTYACYRPAAKVLGMNEASVWVLTLLIGIGAVFQALKSQFSSVIERRHDIGILKAIGWTNGNVINQILAESVFQAVIGGIIGCLLGGALVVFVPMKFLIGVDAQVDLMIYPLVLVAAFLLSLLGGIIAGFFPAMRAAREKPADALRFI